MENNKNNAFINDILVTWGLTSANNDIVDQMHDMGLVVDIHPFQIENPEKNYQVEVFYQKFLDGNISKDTYLNYENKFLNFVKLLWTYNVTDVLYDLFFDKHFLKAFKKNYFVQNKPKSQVINNISSWIELQKLLILALREAGYIFLFFKDWNVIAMINDFSVLILCKDSETNKIIENLSNSCGLFVH